MEIAPFRGLRFDLSRSRELAGGGPEALAAPPYDVIAPDEHRRLLALSPYNITRLTLGDRPGEVSSYTERAALLRAWIEQGVLREDERPSIYAYSAEYRVPAGGGRARMLGFVALGRLAPFAGRVILPHERTFPKVVDDRLRLLEATRANLESILLLYSDPEGLIDGTLSRAVAGEPAMRVEARPGEIHSLYPVDDAEAISRIRRAMEPRRPIIADGHHRYTTALRFLEETRERSPVAGAEWRMMTFANLDAEGISILPTHRLVRLRPGGAEEALALLEERLVPAGETGWDLRVETVRETLPAVIPPSLVAGRRGVARTPYAILHDVILADWLRPWAGDEPEVSYYKEGTGELEALRASPSGLLFRMRPVGRGEFREIVEAGELFPHKTTYFYPKLWSGLVLRRLEDTPHGAGEGEA